MLRFSKNICALSLLGLLLWSGLISAAVEMPSGRYHITHQEFEVKVPGGSIPVQRTWYDERWHFNSAWDSLVVTYDSQGGLERIGHHNDNFKSTGGFKTGGSGQSQGGTISPTFIFGKREQIKPLDSNGFRWEDRDGNWAEYDANGHLQRYGDPIGLTARFAYDNGRLSGVFDRNDRQVLWYVYIGGDLATIHDGGTPQRAVHYIYKDGMLVSATDVRGQNWKYEYKAIHAKQGTVGFSAASGGGSGVLRVSDDPTWRKVMSSHTDPLGRKTSIDFNQSWRVSRITLPDGRWREYLYDYNKTQRDYYTRTTYSDGQILERWYDSVSEITREVGSSNGGYETLRSGNTRTTTDARGLKTVRSYDQWDNLLSVTWPDGSSIRYDVEPTWSNITRSVDERGTVTTYDYDEQGKLITLTEAVGTPAERITEYTYDAAGNQLTEKRLADADTAEALTRYQNFNAGGQPQTIIDAEGNSHQLVYNLAGDITRYTAPNGGLWQLAYNPAGQLSSLTDPLGHTTRYSYDAVGNLKTRTGPAPSSIVTAYAYDAGDRLTALTDALDGVMKLAYDSASGRLTAITDATDITQYQLAYDAGGNLAGLTDAADNTTVYDYGLGEGAAYPGLLNAVHYPTYTERYDYDQRDRPATITEQYGAQSRDTRYQYLPDGNLVGSTDAAGRDSTSSYDALGRLTGETDAEGGTTTYTYDDRDNLISVTNARGVLIRRYAYDRLDRLVSETWPDGRSVTLQYDDAAGTVTRIDAKGQAMRYQTDAAGQLARIDYLATATADTPVRSTVFSRNERGLLTQVSDGTITISYSYDALDRQLTEQVNYGAFSLGYAYEYDAAGRKRALLRPDGIRIGYGYDPAGQLASLTIPGTGTLTWNGYQWNAPTAMTLPGGSAREWAYDGLMRPTLITGKDAGGNPLLQYAYSYDAVDNITARQTEHGDYAYGYDTLDRLTTVDNPSLADEAYSYDAVGNRLSDAQAAGDWLYEDDDRLSARPGVSYQYDANGSLIEQNDNGSITRYGYDIAGRLIEVRDGGDVLIARYAYDPFGRRIQKITGGVTTYFLYSDEGLIAEADGSGAITRQYGWQPDGTWGTAPLYLSVGGKTYYYQNDHLGTPQKLITASGAVVWSAEFEAFGLAHVGVDAVGNPLRFPGQYFDLETGRHYNFFRDYDPGIGRYVTSDPIGLQGGMNTYAYVGGNPLSFIDPLGLDCTAANRIVTCNIPGGPQISFPQPAGWPSSLKPGDSNYHYYNKWVNLPPGVDKKCVEDYLKNHPTPGSPNPATPEGTRNDASPNWVAPFKSSPVASYTMSSNGSQVVVNVTLPGHPLFPGYVARDVNGGVVNNFGEGTGWLQGLNSPFSGPINNVWYGLTDDAIKACSCQ